MTPAQIGRYEITGTLGRGAAGIVYSARDPLIQRTVAIKTVNCVGLSREEIQSFEQRFYREAQSAGQLTHPNIVTIHDVGRCGDMAYIAMEYLAGRSLREVLDDGARLPLKRIASIAAQIADGLAFAHASGIIHRDIKPANILLLENDLVKIADFGVARLPGGSQTQEGATVGSPKYMSPEQVRGAPLDGRSDIFSLGALLHEMLTGRPAFTGNDIDAILHQVLSSDPPPPTLLRPNLPAAADRIVTRALAKSPEARYADAAEMATDLRRLGKIPPPVARPKPAARGDATIELAPRGRPAATFTAAHRRIALVLLASVVLLAGWLFRPTTPPPPNPPPITGAAHATPLPATGAPPPTATAQRGEGQLRIAVAPWGEVHVDGTLAGISPPLAELPLPAGRHEIEIRNGDFAPHRETVDITPGASLRIKHKFE